MHVLHDINDTGCKMFDHNRTQLSLPLNQIIKILSFDPSAHKINSIHIRKDSILFGYEGMGQFATNNSQSGYFFFHLSLDSLVFVDDSHSELNIALWTDFESTAEKSNSPCIDDVEVVEGEAAYIFLYFVDWLDLPPYCLVQIDKTVETSVVLALNSLNADESYPSISPFHQFLGMEPDIKQKISVENFKFGLVVDPSLKTDHEVFDGRSSLGYNLTIFELFYLFELNHGFHNKRRHF